MSNGLRCRRAFPAAAELSCAAFDLSGSNSNGAILGQCLGVVRDNAEGCLLIITDVHVELAKELGQRRCLVVVAHVSID